MRTDGHDGNSEHWRDLYSAALVELSSDELLQRIRDAQRAIVDEIEGAGGFRTEHQALLDALLVLLDLQIVHGGAHRLPKKRGHLVAVPVLPVVAATHGGKGDPEIALEQVRPETVLAAPSSWCPNPAYTSCLRVRGRSMMPLLHDGYIIVVDKSQTYRKKLYGQIVVAAHNEQGLIVSILQRFDGTEVLVPENREHDSIAISSASWRIVAKILWWIGRASEGERLKEAA